MKFIKTLIVFFVTIAILTAVGVLYLAKFQDTSFLGGQLKGILIKQPFIVNTFRFDKPGDGKYIYLDKKYPYINVNVYYTDNNNPSKDTEKWLSDMINSTTGKGIIFNEFKLGDAIIKNNYSDSDLLNLSNSNAGKNNKATLNVFYLSFYKPDPKYLGITLDKESVFIFKGSLDSLGETEKVLSRLEQSTIKHEWGHLLGLGHAAEDDCVMSEKVHFYSDRKLWTGEVPINYCAETLFEIAHLKKSVN